MIALKLYLLAGTLISAAYFSHTPVKTPPEAFALVMSFLTLVVLWLPWLIWCFLREGEVRR